MESHPNQPVTKLRKRLFNSCYVVLAVFSLSLIAYNVCKAWGSVAERISDGVVRTDKNMGFIDNPLLSDSLIKLAAEKTGRKGTIFLWMLPQLRETISAETDALELNYFLYPMQVFYKDEDLIRQADYIICKSKFLENLKHTLQNIKIEKGFIESGRNSYYTILERTK